MNLGTHYVVYREAPDKGMKHVWCTRKQAEAIQKKYTIITWLEPMACLTCSWTGTEDECKQTSVDNDGTIADIYYCPTCGCECEPVGD